MVAEPLPMLTTDAPHNSDRAGSQIGTGGFGHADTGHWVRPRNLAPLIPDGKAYSRTLDLPARALRPGAAPPCWRGRRTVA